MLRERLTLKCSPSRLGSHEDVMEERVIGGRKVHAEENDGSWRNSGRQGM